MNDSAERPQIAADGFVDDSRRLADTLVIGGGPGGSTIATLLRRKGWKVVLCEKDRHPRFLLRIA